MVRRTSPLALVVLVVLTFPLTWIPASAQTEDAPCDLDVCLSIEGTFAVDFAAGVQPPTAGEAPGIFRMQPIAIRAVGVWDQHPVSDTVTTTTITGNYVGDQSAFDLISDPAIAVGSGGPAPFPLVSIVFSAQIVAGHIMLKGEVKDNSGAAAAALQCWGAMIPLAAAGLVPWTTAIAVIKCAAAQVNFRILDVCKASRGYTQYVGRRLVVTSVVSLTPNVIDDVQIQNDNAQGGGRFYYHCAAGAKGQTGQILYSYVNTQTGTRSSTILVLAVR